MRDAARILRSGAEREGLVLTADLVAARRHKGQLRIVRLDARMRERALELAGAYLDIARAHVGRTRDELDEAWAAVETGPREQRLAAGLRKLVEDRCEFDAGETLEPEALRGELFLRAAARRRALGDGAVFDRDTLVAEVAAERSTEVAAIERALYADLRGAHVLRALRPVSASALATGYDLAQAQAVLLRAVRVVVEVSCARPGTYRALFRKLKFLRLLHTITRCERGLDGAADNGDDGGAKRRKDKQTGDPGYRIEIDGPFSLFESVTRYGLALALALPAVATCDRFRLEADVRWGRERLPLEFRLEGECGDLGGDEAAGTGTEADVDANAAASAVPAGDEPPLADEVATLLDALCKLDSPWAAAPSSEILDLPGAGLCVPDLVLEHAATGERVYVEVMGFWSRDAVWRRVELVERGLPWRIVFAVSRHLRVSEAALDDEAPAALYVYRRTMSARALVDKVEALVKRGGGS